jgi:hypothetical protein
VQHQVEVAEPAGFEGVKQTSGIDEIDEGEWHQIPPLGVVTEEIRDDYLLDAAIVELMDQPAPDEAGPARNEDPVAWCETHAPKLRLGVLSPRSEKC